MGVRPDCFISGDLSCYDGCDDTGVSGSAAGQPRHGCDGLHRPEMGMGCRAEAPGGCCRCEMLHCVDKCVCYGRSATDGKGYQEISKLR